MYREDGVKHGPTRDYRYNVSLVRRKSGNRYAKYEKKGSGNTKKIVSQHEVVIWIICWKEDLIEGE